MGLGWILRRLAGGEVEWIHLAQIRDWDSTPSGLGCNISTIPPSFINTKGSFHMNYVLCSMTNNAIFFINRVNAINCKDLVPVPIVSHMQISFRSLLLGHLCRYRQYT
jgi:hypothetical protein